MNNEIVSDICVWNYVRGNTEYDGTLEYDMLSEELEEYGVSRDIANTAKELADIIFVAVGSLYKLTGANPQKVEDILQSVIVSNRAKGTEKSLLGKVKKGREYVNPEKVIAQILETPPCLFTYDIKE